MGVGGRGSPPAIEPLFEPEVAFVGGQVSGESAGRFRGGLRGSGGGKINDHEFY